MDAQRPFEYPAVLFSTSNVGNDCCIVRFYFKFLVANNREIAKEIKDHYIDTMSKVTVSYFKSYSGRLSKLQYDEVPSQDDLMGADDTVPKGFFSKPASRTKASVFSMGQRGQVLNLEDLEGPLVVPHTTTQKCPFEKLFRSEQFALLENACREYVFLSEFFMLQGTNADDIFHQVMDKTLVLLQGMSITVMEFQDQGYKIRKIFA